MSKLLDTLANMKQFADGRYELASDYAGYNKPIDISCTKHKYTFQLPEASQLLSKPAGAFFDGCPECKVERRSRPRVKVNCAYCGKEMFRPDNWSEKNKTDLAFCCREHKILAQRIGGILVPSHYGKAFSSDSSVSTNRSEYRRLAFHVYPHRCAVCGYNNVLDILEVHHIDGNRANNDISNLIILCPNCHRLVTLKLYSVRRDGDEVIFSTVENPEDVRKQDYNIKKKNSVGGFYTNRLVYCIEDKKYFMTYIKAAEYYHVSDTTIRSAALNDSNYCRSLNKHFQLVDIEQV